MHPPSLPRREFLRTAAASLAFTALASRPGRAETRRGIGLGFSLYGMKTLPIETALAACATIGYDNVELALNPGFPTEPKLLSPADRKNIRSQLGSLGLTISAIMDNLSLTADDAAHAANLDRIKAAAQLAHDLAPGFPPLLETVLGGKPAEWDGIKDRMVARLKSWAGVAASGGIVIAIKAHVSSAVNSPERVLWLLQQVASPAIKLTYDYSHFELQGIALADSLKVMLPETRFIHVKDTAGAAGKPQFLLPGEGRTDYATYFGLLKSLGYHGAICVEVSSMISKLPDYDPVVAARKCYAPLAAAFETAGIDRKGR